MYRAVAETNNSVMRKLLDWSVGNIDWEASISFASYYEIMQYY